MEITGNSSVSYNPIQNSGSSELTFAAESAFMGELQSRIGAYTDISAADPLNQVDVSPFNDDFNQAVLNDLDQLKQIVNTACDDIERDHPGFSFDSEARQDLVLTFAPIIG